MSFGIAVFPYLKTSGRFWLGGLLFRSTDDIDDLPQEQRDAVREVAGMLFLKDDRRIVTATFSIIDAVNINRRGPQLELLSDIRAVAAYAYSSPHDVFDSLFLTPEDVSLIILSPASVSEFLVYPEHYVEAAEGSAPRVLADERHNIPGYEGLYNFVEPIWAVVGSRLYPPRPRASLIIAQDMAADFAGHFSGRTGTEYLLALINRRNHSQRNRIFTALRWYNYANEAMAGPDRSLLNLAVAFEALFNLPQSAKSERLADSISLILGRANRISDWATQFYEARSRVAHEGTARELYYRPAIEQKKGAEGRFGTLMLSGRAIFRLCMATLLTGLTLSDEARLAEKLVSNTERYTRVCSLLQGDSAEPRQALEAIAPIVQEIARHRFVDSTPVDVDLMLVAVRLTCSAFLIASQSLPEPIASAVKLCASTSNNLFSRLDSVRQLREILEVRDVVKPDTDGQTLRILLDEVWNAVFMTYYAIKRDQESRIEAEH